MIKVSLFGLEITGGKIKIKDERLDKIKELYSASKKTYLELEVTTQDKASQSDGLVVLKDNRLDVIIVDLEFIDKRLLSPQEEEKKLLLSLKEALEKEKFINEIQLTETDKDLLKQYPLLSNKPVFLVEDAAEDIQKILFSAYYRMGFINFFTAGPKEARSWSIEKDITAYDASGCIHSDIQKGFIKAEVLAYKDLIDSESFNNARSKGLVRLENRDYVIKDGDIITFRFNK
ncbi:MAG: DUF933 domain-containing protein [Candidatus Gygaella obscura]|nr:DUF933 domain-containing protein [Candidatus Gygaella obscura]